MIIHLSRISPRARSRGRGTVMRRYPRIKRAGCPPSVLSCTAWGFSCLANCFASGELLPRLFTLTCALLPKNRRCLFCDTFRHRSFFNRGARVFYAACCRMVFGLSSSKPQAARQRSSAIGPKFSTKTEILKPRNYEKSGCRVGAPPAIRFGQP